MMIQHYNFDQNNKFKCGFNKMLPAIEVDDICHYHTTKYDALIEFIIIINYTS